MSGQWFVLRLLTGCVFGGMMAWLCFSRFDPEVGEEESWTGQRYLPYLPSLLLPAFLTLAVCVALPMLGWRETAQMLLGGCFSVALSISVYYALLSLLLPLLRMHISARGCAMLWIIPNYLYIMGQSFMVLPEPVAVLEIGEEAFLLVTLLWLGGFLAVLVWKVAQHYLFRRSLLKDARPVTDEETLTIWREELENAGVNGRPSPLGRLLEKLGRPAWSMERALVIAHNATTPLSIGGFRRKALRVVLPEKAYTPEELKLVLRHELVHICREDSGNKFFLVFCRALCWFNPLVWLSTRRGAEDMELSCDETVLLEADEATRRRYAELLLQTAGDERGFTTCLAASASALRYRLGRIMKPGKVRTGALAVLLAFVLLCMSFGHVALSFDAGLLGEEVFGGTQPQSIRVSSLTCGDTPMECASEEALLTYLAGLDVSRIMGNYDFTGDEEALSMMCRGQERSFVLTVTDRTVTMRYLGQVQARQKCFYLDEALDWAYVNSLLRTKG